jgi:hypothetical protein
MKRVFPYQSIQTPSFNTQSLFPNTLRFDRGSGAYSRHSGLKLLAVGGNLQPQSPQANTSLSDHHSITPSAQETPPSKCWAAVTSIAYYHLAIITLNLLLAAWHLAVLGEVMATVVAFEATAVLLGIEAEEAGDLEIEATLMEGEVKVVGFVGDSEEVLVVGVEVLHRCTRKGRPLRTTMLTF